MSGGSLDAAALAAISGLPYMGPRALAALLAGRTPLEAWAAVRQGRVGRGALLASASGSDPSGRAEMWAARTAHIDLDALASAHRAAGVRLMLPGDTGWPERLDGDPEPPVVLCVRGELAGLERPSCGIVGTRSCTPDGRRVAYELGRELADAGVAVVSGLALGVDAASHRGCLAADPVEGAALGAPFGVVAGGVDVVYPASHRDLYGAVAAAGALISEAPLGTRPERWRFPARNRIIAALADIVVVVETPERGGSLHTVEAALERDRMIGAVPGPVLSVASRGTNGMIADGAQVVRGADDVLVALGLGGSRPTGRPDGPRAVQAELARLGPMAAAVHTAVGVTPTPLEAIVKGSGLPIAEALGGLQQLCAAGLVDDCAGQWSRAGAVR